MDPKAFIPLLHRANFSTCRFAMSANRDIPHLTDNSSNGECLIRGRWHEKIGLLTTFWHPSEALDGLVATLRLRIEAFPVGLLTFPGGNETLCAPPALWKASSVHSLFDTSHSPGSPSLAEPAESPEGAEVRGFCGEALLLYRRAPGIRGGAVCHMRSISSGVSS
jgi:hypothetical protein